MKPLLPLLSFVVLCTACGSNASMDTPHNVAAEQEPDTVDYKSVIVESNKAFTDAAMNGDSATFVATLYHPDANIFPPNMETMDPKQTGAMFSSLPKMGVKSFTLDTKEVYRGDEVVTEVGTYEMGDGNKAIDKGKYMVIWKKDGDKWKLFRDIWNSDNPPPPGDTKKK
jgi:ketosteroid isomerase-like protein